MKCPRCGYAETKVIDSRDVDTNQSIRRRRECLHCESRFTTFERVGFTELMVNKKDGTKELYDRDKLKRSILLACAKRSINIEDIHNLITNLEIERLARGNEISSQTIGEDVIQELKSIDPIAYIRFASVYQNFDTLADFARLIHN